jgi:hypothetical protein
MLSTAATLGALPPRTQPVGWFARVRRARGEADGRDDAFRPRLARRLCDAAGLCPISSRSCGRRRGRPARSRSFCAARSFTDATSRSGSVGGAGAAELLMAPLYWAFAAGARILAGRPGCPAPRSAACPQPPIGARSAHGAGWKARAGRVSLLAALWRARRPSFSGVQPRRGEIVRDAACLQ